jgi:hypothetical protein
MYIESEERRSEQVRRFSKRTAMKYGRRFGPSSSEFSVRSFVSWFVSLAVLAIFTISTGFCAQAVPSLPGRTVRNVSSSRSESQDTAPLLLAGMDPACVSQCGVRLKECMQSCTSSEKVTCMRGCVDLALPQRTKCVADCQVDSSCQDTCLRDHKGCVGGC